MVISKVYVGHTNSYVGYSFSSALTSAVFHFWPLYIIFTPTPCIFECN